MIYTHAYPKRVNFFSLSQKKGNKLVADSHEARFVYAPTLSNLARGYSCEYFQD